MSAPYYQDDSVTLYRGDCRDVLPTLKRESVDVVLTDPPFFMPATHYQSRNTVQRSWGDTSILATFWATVLDHITPVLRRTGHLLAFCNGDSYPVFYPETYRRFDAVRALSWNWGAAQHIWAAALVEQRKHPVDKPISLLSSIIRPVVPINGVQRGTSACERIEQNRYCEAIARRFDQGTFNFGAAS